MKKKILLIPLALLLAISLVAIGCAPPAPAPPAPGVPAPVEVIKWTGQNHGMPVHLMYLIMLQMFEEIEAATGGRLVPTLHSGGGIVPAETEGESVDRGAIDFAITCPGYWKTVFPAAGLFTYVSGGLSAIEFMAWMEVGGGQELEEEMVKTWNVEMLDWAGAMLTPEVMIQANRPITTLDDLKGLKMRAFGDGGEILAMLGIAMVHFPSMEIYENMERGVIDAFDHTSLTGNWDASDQEVAPYLYLSPSRQGMEWQPFLVNKDIWAELPDDLKAIVTEFGRTLAYEVYWAYVASDTTAAQKFIDYGCTVEAVSDEIEEAFAKAATEFYAKECAKDAFIARIYGSQMKWMESVRTAFPRL